METICATGSGSALRGIKPQEHRVASFPLKNSAPAATKKGVSLAYRPMLWRHDPTRAWDGARVGERQMKSLRLAFDAMMDARAAPLEAAGPDKAARLALVQRHGDFSQAYSTAVQEGLRHFGDRQGYIAYGAKMGSRIALGDPVAEREFWPELIGGFIEKAGRPCFAEISHETATILAARGYLDWYDFSGHKKEKARYASHWLRRNGYRIVEEPELPGAAEAAGALSAQWRCSRIVHRREMAFMNRPFPTTPDPLMRRFLLLSPEGAPVSLLYFDPVFSDGKVIGYVAVFKRRLSDVTAHAEIGITKHAVDLFRQEGRKVVLLSLAPFADPRPSGFPESTAFRWAMGQLYRSRVVNQRVFNVQGHAEQRRRLYGRTIPRYFAWGCGSPFLHLVSLLRLCKAI
jgi:lysylphosphatidylglycerol synthetase-like protein (DUF2156 family)